MHSVVRNIVWLIQLQTIRCYCPLELPTISPSSFPEQLSMVDRLPHNVPDQRYMNSISSLAGHIEAYDGARDCSNAARIIQSRGTPRTRDHPGVHLSSFGISNRFIAIVRRPMFTRNALAARLSPVSSVLVGGLDRVVISPHGCSDIPMTVVMECLKFMQFEAENSYNSRTRLHIISIEVPRYGVFCNQC
jgi:hypothetical protein